MSDLKIALAGSIYQAEQSTTQIAILASANAWTFSIPTAGVPIALITTATPHGLTFTPTAGTMPNFFVTFQGNITAQTGPGTIIGNLFRILTIPSTTTFTIATTVLTATAATTAGIVPVFIPQFQVGVGSVFAGGPQVGTPLAPAIGTYTSSENVCLTTGPNCVVNYYPDNTSVILDSSNTSTASPTPTTAPTARVLLAASSQGQVWFDGAASTLLVASGTAGTSRASVIA
jgi:hypothetical protein